MNVNPSHHLQILFRNKDGSPIANTRYRLHFNGQQLKGNTDENGYTELVQGNSKPIEIWLIKDGEKPERIGKAKPRPVKQKPVLVARQVAKPLIVKASTEEHAKKPVTKVPLKKYSVQFNVPSFSCTGRVSYRLVQDGKVLAEDRTQNKTQRIHTDSESEVSLYIAGDKRYKKGEAYVAEESATKPVTSIPAWANATPSKDIKHIEKTATFDKHDWVDVSKIYGIDHPDITTESKGIYAGEWAPPPSPDARDRRYVTTVDGREVVLFWEDGSCNNGLQTHGRKTFTTLVPKQTRYMSVDQVIARTHPKVFKVLFDVIKELNLNYMRISSSWRPGIGSSAHREGRALDITRVETETTKVAASDLLPGGKQVDYTDKPTGKEPDLMEKVRQALYNHTEVEQIFTPWHLMSARGKTFAASFQESVVKKPKDTASAHRNHLHFHIKLD